MGTSFASPIVASLTGRLIGESKNTIDTLTAKALMIHSAREDNTIYKHCPEIGHGFITNEFDKIVSCSEESYTLIYRGELDTSKYAEFPIPWDEEIIDGKAKLRWTVAVLTDVDQLSSDDYTSSSVEIAFYPNRNKYTFKNEPGLPLDGKNQKTEVVDVSKDPDRAQYLLDNDWVQSNFPQTDSAKSQFRTETELREDLKWDSIDTRQLSKYAKSISEPTFHIHALGRGNRNGVKKIKFALILTVETPKTEIDLYTSILNKYSALIPLEVNINVHSETRIENTLNNI